MLYTRDNRLFIICQILDVQVTVNIV